MEPARQATDASGYAYADIRTGSWLSQMGQVIVSLCRFPLLGFMVNTNSVITSEGDRPRVLAVEDDRFMSAVIDSVLREAGIDVIAADVQQAVKLIETDDFDLILCDRSMPGIGGQEFLSMVRSKPRHDFTPFMFLTSSEELDDMVAGFEAGADDYLTKPFHPSELAARVTSRLERARQIKSRSQEMADVETLAFEFEREVTRVREGGRGGVLALVDIPSLQAVESLLGDRERRAVLEAIAAVMVERSGPLDMIGATRYADLAILMPRTEARAAASRPPHWRASPVDALWTREENEVSAIAR